MTEEEMILIEQMDLAFWTARAKDKTLNRGVFNEEWRKTHKPKPPERVDYFADIMATAPTDLHKKVYELFAQYGAKFPNVETKNIVLMGRTGVGKTVAVKSLRDELKQRKVWVEYATSFGMVAEFRNYCNSFGRETDVVDDYVNCDVLIIDDLGAEPVIKNITNEFFCNIINERIENNRAFIITTNLDAKGLMERYDQRIASRILSRISGAVIDFDGADLRLKGGNGK